MNEKVSHDSREEEDGQMKGYFDVSEAEFGGLLYRVALTIMTSMF